jgi:glutamate-1-semialdehyde 2,1-aminomutase
LQSKAYLQFLRDICTKYNVLLIFDEVISGFRVGFEGASGYYDIPADIYTFGKIIGGGMPVGAYGASHQIMSMIAPEGPVYQAGTLSANPVAMAAGYAALQPLLADGFYQKMEKKTALFVNTIMAHVTAKGYELTLPRIGSIFWFCFSNNTITRADQIDASKMEYFKRLHVFLLEQGVYLGPSGYEVGFISAAHEEKDLLEAAAIICDGLDVAFS